MILSAPPCRNRRQPEGFSQEFARETRQKRHDGRGFYDAAAESVCDDNATCIDGVHESGDSEERLAAQFEGIAETIVYAAENHINGPQPFHGLQVVLDLRRGR